MLAVVIALIAIFSIRYWTHYKIKEIAHPYITSFEESDLSIVMQSQLFNPLVSEYSFWRTTEGEHDHFCGSPALVGMSESELKWDGSLILYDTYEDTPASIVTVYKGDFNFLLGVFVLGSLVNFVITSISLFRYSKEREKGIEFRTSYSHEVVYSIGVHNTAKIFRHRCGQAASLMYGERLKHEYTPLLVDLIDLWKKSYSPNIEFKKGNFNFDYNLRVHDQPLSLLVCNIISNAVKHTCEEYIKISIVQNKKFLSFQVTNFTKQKASLEDQRSIAGDNSQTGLRIVESLLKKYYRSKKFRAKYSDNETTISFSIPLSLIKVENNISSFMFEPKVAILDDNSEILTNLTKELEAFECKVDAYSHIDDLLAEVQKRPGYYNLIISDRKGEGYIDRSPWDAVDEDLPEIAKEMGYEGLIFLYTVAGEKSDTKGFDKILAKGFEHDWRYEMEKFFK